MDKVSNNISYPPATMAAWAALVAFTTLSLVEYWVKFLLSVSSVDMWVCWAAKWLDTIVQIWYKHTFQDGRLNVCQHKISPGILVSLYYVKINNTLKLNLNAHQTKCICPYSTFQKDNYGLF